MTEQVSAFLDGELDRDRLEKNIQTLLSDKQTLQIYKEYQQVGEALRGDADTVAKSDLTSRIMANIEAEPTVLSPNAMPERPVQPSKKHEQLPDSAKEKSLSPTWSIAASLAAVVAVGYLTMDQFSSSESTLAQLPVVAAVQTQAPTSNIVQQYATVDEIPPQYIQAHHLSAPTVGTHYIQSVNYSE